MVTMSSPGWPVLAPSTTASNTYNPIRKHVDFLKIAPPPGKEYISLALGDPTIFGNFKTHPIVVEIFKKKLTSGNWNGYPPSAGSEEARTAVAKHYSVPGFPLSAKNVILASGCSGALEMTINAVVSPGENILLPSPGFSIYQTICQSRGIECRSYPCIPENNWEIDLHQLVSLIDGNTKAILINNPSNPCGSVFSKEHLLRILEVAEKYKLPIISDEIYDGMVFNQATFYSMASLSKTVPILTCGGLSKKLMIPGWRLGWVIVHDRHGALVEVEKGIVNLSAIVLGPNSLIQSSLPELLESLPAKYIEDNNRILEEHVAIIVNGLKNVKGLKVVIPNGAMYLMAKVESSAFKDIVDDSEFSSKLLAEEAVFCLPAEIFKAPGFIRIVITPPKEKLTEACDRIRAFCQRHYK